MASQSPASESLEVRMARQEGALPFLATKADISELRGEIRALHAEMKITRRYIALLGAALSVLMYVFRGIG